MKHLFGLASCSTLLLEVRECCQQLGIPIRCYATRPACLFEADRQRLEDLLARAAAQHERLIVALGECCGKVEQLIPRSGAGLLSGEACTEMLSGAGTHEWCVAHGVLLLPPPHFSTWLRRVEEDRAAQQAFISRITSQRFERVAAIDEPRKHPDPIGMTQIGALASCETTTLYTGLGHLREAVRVAAEDAGIPVPSSKPSPIDPATLGPGDHCILLHTDPATRAQTAAQLVARNLNRGVKSVWVCADLLDGELSRCLSEATESFQKRRASGELQVMSSEELLADSAAEAEPRWLVAYWIDRALEVLAEGYSGLCLVHGVGWAERAGLPSEYVLEYVSRLSAACAAWPILAADEVSDDSGEPHLREELIRTHSLTWTERGLAATEGYTPAHHYLGGQLVLERLADQPGKLHCKELAPLISALVDGELPDAPAHILAQHVEQCPICGQVARSSERMKQLLQSLSTTKPAVPDDLWEQIRVEIDLQD